MRKVGILVFVALCSLVAVAPRARAQGLRPRFATQVQGDLTIAANAIMTCSTQGPLNPGNCMSARSGSSGSQFNNDYTMTWIDADGSVASATVTYNSSKAHLNVPAGAEVLWAGLYWGCPEATGTPPASPRRHGVLFRTPGLGADYVPLTATATSALGGTVQRYVEVTSQVASARSGEYWVGNLWCTRDAPQLFGGWMILVAFRATSEPLRDLTVYEPMIAYGGAAGTKTFEISGFVTPAAGTVTTRVGLLLYDGDRGAQDRLTIISGQRTTSISGALNPIDDIGNSSITRFGTTIPRTPSYVNNLGFDADLLPANDALANTATSARIALSASSEGLYLGVLTFATDILAPELDVTKSATDVNGAPLAPGDEIEYRIVAANRGTERSILTALVDPIPAGTTYVPGSLELAGAALTDAIDTDAGDFDAGAVHVYLGTSATSSIGGSVAAGGSTTVTFRVRVRADAADGTVIANAGEVTYAGPTVGPSRLYVRVSDADPATPGDQATANTVFAPAPIDAGVIDSGLTDTGAPDAGGIDAQQADADHSDGGTTPDADTPPQRDAEPEDGLVAADAAPPADATDTTDAAEPLPLDATPALDAEAADAAARDTGISMDATAPDARRNPDATPAPPDGGTAADAGDGDDEGGCGCAAAPAAQARAPAASWLVLLALGLLLRRRVTRDHLRGRDQLAIR